MAAGMTKRDQYTLSAKTCNRGILQIDVSGASVFGWFQTFLCPGQEVVYLKVAFSPRIQAAR